jgi:hypothetical protein
MVVAVVPLSGASGDGAAVGELDGDEDADGFGGEDPVAEGAALADLLAAGWVCVGEGCAEPPALCEAGGDALGFGVELARLVAAEGVGLGVGVGVAASLGEALRQMSAARVAYVVAVRTVRGSCKALAAHRSH